MADAGKPHMRKAPRASQPPGQQQPGRQRARRTAPSSSHRGQQAAMQRPARPIRPGRPARPTSASESRRSIPPQPRGAHRINPFGAQSAQYLNHPRRVNRTPLIVGAVALVFVVVLGVRFCMNSLEEQRLRAEAEAAAAAEAAKPKPSFALIDADLDGFSGEAALTTFTMAEHDKKPKVKTARLAAIQSAIDTIKQVADIGFVFFDTETGRGITYNADL